MPTESPRTHRYRLIEDYRDTYRFRDGTIRITFRGDEDDCWKLYAEKEGDPHRRCELMRRPTMMAWNHARFEGFDVIADSPADKVMRRLVREGAAEALNSGELNGRQHP